MACVVCKYLNRIVLIRFRLEDPAQARCLSIRCSQAEYGIVLIIVGTGDESHVIERDAVAAEINIRLRVGEDGIAQDGVLRTESHRHTSASIEGNCVAGRSPGTADRVVR